MIDCPFARPPSVFSLLRPIASLALAWAMGCAAPVVDPGGPPPDLAAPSTEAPLTPSNLRVVARDAPVPLFDWTEEVDFDGFRHWFGRREDFTTRCEGSPVRNRAGESLVVEDYAEAERLTAPLVAQCPVDPSLHLWRYAALLSLGRESEAMLHRDWYVGLMESILTTGDGASPETAIVTISNSETFAVLSHLGLTAERQWHVAGPPALDVFVARTDAGERTSLYFHPAFRALREKVALAR